MDWSASPTTHSSLGGTESGEDVPSEKRELPPETSSLIRTYWAWLVSWYSSTSTCRNRRRYASATSGNAWNRLTVTMIRSSKSSAPAATRRRWYSAYASAMPFGGYWRASSSSSRQTSAISRWESAAS